MCVVSMVHDHYNDKWGPQIFPWFNEPLNPPYKVVIPEVTKQDIENLRKEFKKDMEEMRKLLKRAREYDRKNNEPDCPMDDKLNLLRDIAKAMNVDVSFVEKDAADENRKDATTSTSQ